MVTFSVPTTALAACGVIGFAMAVPHDAAVDLAARDITTVTVTVTTCSETGFTYPPGSVVSSGPVETPGTPYTSATPITSAEVPPGYSASSITTSVETSTAETTSTSVVPPVPTSSETTAVKTTSTPTSVQTTSATSSTASSVSSTHTSTTPPASTSIPPAVGVAAKINIHNGVLVALAIGVFI